MKDLIENTADTLQIDKKNWTKVKFGSVAIQQKNAVDRDKTDLTFYVKGEHMGSQDLHLREWGDLTDEYLGPAFIRYFEKDDILYGSRRTYLRKVVIAPFEGITSNTTLVIKANEKIIDKRLLPFVMMSEGFTDHSIKNSKGSVNPYINWKDLANYEFLLPPKAEQARLAELLWAMDDVIEKEKKVLEGFEDYTKSLQKYLFNKNKFSRTKMYEYANVLGGFAFPSSKFVSTGTPVIKIKNIVNGSIIVDDDSNHILEDDFENINKYKLETGDILIAMTGATLGKIGIVQNEFEGSYINQRVGKFELKNNINASFLRGILDSPYYMFELNKYIGEGAQGNVSSDDICKTSVPKLGQTEIEKYGKFFRKMFENRILTMEKISSSQSLQKSLINQIF